MKDLPTTPVPGLVVVAIPDLKARDDIVILKSTHKHLKTLDNLPEGSIIGTSSLRRICTLKQKYPNLIIEDIRGNLNTRLRKLEEEEFDAIILAKAGVVRLGWEDKIDQVLDKAEFQYPPAQGALAIQ
jgi:hydroxymethylbilane synthase